MPFRFQNSVTTMTEAIPMHQSLIDRLKSKKGKELYGYQAEAIDKILG